MNWMLLRARREALALILWLASYNTPAATYLPGDIMPDLEFYKHASSEVFHLGDFAGKVVVLGWFAHWCPFCQQAADPVHDLIQGYLAAGGNTNGVPVAFVALNLVADDQDAQTDAFIAAHGMDLVADDPQRKLAGLFRSASQPIFAVINCVSNSPTHKLNELALNYLGFDPNSTIGALRAAIDSVKPAGATASPRLYTDLRSDEPMSQGGSITLRVEALGTLPLRYEWFKDSQPLPGGSSETWQITHAGDADAGSYSVRVSNEQGTVNSRIAKVQVLLPPVFTGLQFNPNGEALLGIRTKIGRFYQIQASNDLIGWQILGQFVAGGVTTVARDAAVVNVPHRFYRLIEQ